MTFDQPESKPSTKPRPDFRTAALSRVAPSVRDIIFIFLFWSILAGTLSNRPLADPDIGWHIRTGENILATHTLPRTDPFSSTMAGQPWYAWEWLYDLLLGVLHRFCGLNGVAWLCAVVVSSTFIILLSQLLKRGTGLVLAIALMLLAEAAATVHLYARPHIASWILTLLWFVALERLERERAPRWLLWFFPVSMLLWVNLHGAWPFGLTLLAIYIVASRVESLRTKDEFAAIRAAQRARGMLWAGIASLLATLANPFGWHLHEHIYRYLTDRYLMARIGEFRSPDFHGWAQRCFALIILSTLLAFAGRRRNRRLSHLLVVLLSVYAGLFSTRNLPVSSMLLVLIAGPMLWDEFVTFSENPNAWGWLRMRALGIVEFCDRMGAQELELRGHLWPMVAITLALAICLHGGRIGSRQLIHTRFDPKKVPVAAADFLEKAGSNEPIFSTDSWGGFFIYRFYPRPVVIDDRHDLYGSARVREILSLMQGEPGWQNVLEKWQIHTIVLPEDATLVSLLRQLPQDWRPVYEDHVAVVFEKN